MTETIVSYASAGFFHVLSTMGSALIIFAILAGSGHFISQIAKIIIAGAIACLVIPFILDTVVFAFLAVSAWKLTKTFIRPLNSAWEWLYAQIYDRFYDDGVGLAARRKIRKLIPGKKKGNGPVSIRGELNRP